jgi:hypothetical protein
MLAGFPSASDRRNSVWPVSTSNTRTRRSGEFASAIAMSEPSSENAKCQIYGEPPRLKPIFAELNRVTGLLAAGCGGNGIRRRKKRDGESDDIGSIKHENVTLG